MKYYHIDASPFCTKVKLCFDQEGVDSILKDHDIDFTVDAFDMGIAETHYISDGRDGIILVIIDLDKCDHDLHFRCGVIAHEAYHTACRVFQHIGEKLYDVGEEVFAYTIEHIVKQMSVAVGKELDAREKRRSSTDKASKGKRRTKLQVDQHSDGRTGSHSVGEWDSFFRGTEDKDGSTIGTSKADIHTNGRTRTAGIRAKNLRGHR